MKKLHICLAICLCFCVPALAADAVFDAEGVFTVAYDDASFIVDSETYAAENTDDSYHWFAMIYNESYLFDLTMFQSDYASYDEALSGLTLFSADEATRQLYLSYMLDSYADDDIQYLKTVEVGQYKIPFAFFTATDSEGLYLFAETVVQGKAIRFACYYHNAALGVDAALLDALTAFVSTFVPAV